MKLFGVTFTYNESVMIPYVMKYLEHMGFDKLIVYDNQSTDNTVKLLKQYKFVEVRTLDTGGKKSNQEIVNIKNKVWKEFKNEKDAWMFVSDFDEVLYYPGNLKEYLDKVGKDGYNYLNQEMLETMCEHFPDNSKYVHEVCDGGTFWGLNGCKMTLFKLDTFSSVSYTPGAHVVTVSLNDGKKLKALNDKAIKSFHLKNIDHTFCLKKKNTAQVRRGKNDIKCGYGIQYAISDAEFDKKWRTLRRGLIKIDDYLNGKRCGCDASRRIRITGMVNKTWPLEEIYPNMTMNTKKRVERKPLKLNNKVLVRKFK